MLDYIKIINKITIFIKKYVRKANANGVVIGLSGGIDSSVVAALSIKALGRKNVFGIILPCQNDNKDIDDAIFLAETLDINYRIINLSNAYLDFVRNLNENNELISPTIYGNMKSRLRMVTLYFEAAKRNYLVIGTTNKSELITGYYTKYGDGGVDFEPIGDFLKKEIIAIAKYLKIPKRIIKNKPKSGLIDNSSDEKEFGFKYKELDKYIETGVGDKKIINKIEKLIERNKHKRKLPKVFKLKHNIKITEKRF